MSTQNDNRSVSRPTALFVQWLEKTLPGLQPGNALPPVPEMARQWSVSPGTVRTVLRRYQNLGKLFLVPGRGTFVPPGTGTVKVEVASGTPSVQSVVDYIAGQIRSGTLRFGQALPTVKFMCVQFKVAPRSVTNAYRQLSLHGLVTRVGKTWWAGAGEQEPRPALARGLFLFCEEREAALLYDGDWLSQAYLRFEYELRRHGFSVTYARSGDIANLASKWARTKCPDALAFVNQYPAAFASIESSISRILRGAHPPRVLVDWHEGDYRGRPSGPGVAVLSRGNIYTTRAKHIAAFALQSNFEEVVIYFDETTTSFDEFLPIMRIRCELEALGGQCRFAPIICPKGNSLPADFFNRLYAARAPERVATVLSKYTPTSHTALEQQCRFVDSVDNAVRLTAGRTLYVFARDEHAVSARESARKRRLRVPQDIALLSLENRPESVHHGISCCVPDWDQTGYLMAHALIGDFTVERTGKGFLRVRSTLLERGTT